MSRLSEIARTSVILSLVVATQASGDATQTTIACIEKTAAVTNENAGYIFSVNANSDLFVENEPTAGGAPTLIYILAGADTLANLIENETLDGLIQWTGVGSRAGQLARVRVPEDKNKVYQIDLASMQGTIILGYRPVAQLTCQVRK